MDLNISAGLFRRTVTLMMIFETVKNIELQSIEVPSWVPLSSRATLSCRWALGPADVLYSVKWYKDGKEFFRHVPRDSETRRRFPLPGVDVEDADSLGSQLKLSPTSLESSGRYRCEVSGEGPLFPTVSDYADMNVVVLPHHGPIITGFNSKYGIGDKVHINCTSGRSQPATQLSWYINGDPLSIDEYTTSYKSEDSLIVTVLSLEFEVTEVYFKKSALKVKCLAIIKPMYWKSNEETAIIENATLLSPVTSNVPILSKTQKTKRNKMDHSMRSSANAYVAGLIFKILSLIGVLFLTN